MRPSILPRALLGLALAALFACGGGGDKSDLVARVGDEKITVEDVAGYMQRANYGANLKDVERAVNEIVDAHLALSRAHERYHPAPVESLQMQEWRNTLMVNQFRDDVMYKDLQVDESKLRAWYNDNVGERATVDHILIRVPPNASTEEKQAAKHEADSLLTALKGGADFAKVAREHSDDRSSADKGGRMEPFERGRMVEPFEKAAFETPIGEYAPVVESQFGYHILRVVDRSKPKLSEVREEIEQQLKEPMKREAEDRYLTQVMEGSKLEFHERNIATVIQAIDDQTPPTAEQRDLPLASFEGGRIALGEIWDLYQLLPQGNRQAIDRLDVTGMVQALASMVQQRIILARAEARGVELDSTRQGQLDERIDQLLLSAYLRDASQARMQVSDAEVRQYYDEHREFYADRPFDEVAPEVRQVLLSQRLEEVSGPEAQRATLAAIADSQEQSVKVERFTDTYDKVLRTLRDERQKAGIPEPGPAPEGGQAAGRGPASAPASAPAPTPGAATGGAGAP